MKTEKAILATYENHGTHAEGIEVLFDPSELSYRKLLEFFFQIHWVRPEWKM